jgi:hypothetical protein
MKMGRKKDVPLVEPQKIDPALKPADIDDPEIERHLQEGDEPSKRGDLSG